MYSLDQLASGSTSCHPGSGSEALLNDARLSKRPHICAFFSRRDDEYMTLLSYMREGLARGEKVFQTIDPGRMADHLQRLQGAGIDYHSLQQSGQLEICDWTASHLPGPTFVPQRTIEFYQHKRVEAQQHGFKKTRFFTQMEWALDALETFDDLLEYEAQANQSWIMKKAPFHPVICTYDLNRFGADVVADIVRTHPLIILGGVVQENPFFVPPGDFLQDLRLRRASRFS